MSPRRGFLRALVVVLVAGSLPAVVAGEVAVAEPKPSVALPQTSSVGVDAEPGRTRGSDQATDRALTTSQSPVPTAPGSGSPTATPLSPSANWEVSASSGDFAWNYPLRVPPVPGGLAPELALSYSSSSVDGRSSVTNNQPSWIGEGWDLSPGFVERTYGSCFDDGVEIGDLCWRSDNASASYGSGGGMLICCDGDGRWRSRFDDGSLIVRHTGKANGDDNGEYWQITTVDGTQYWFGSQPDAGSTWTVPVFGDDAGEPCHTPGNVAASHCTQAWRWNLDKVVDRNGNVIRYYYAPETNNYGLNLKDNGVSYVRGGTLARVDYGLNEDVDAPPAGQVEFTSVDRCIPGLPASECGHDKKGNWPDTPLNLACGATCTNYAPSFWTTKRLSTITTKVRRSTGLEPVDRWTLRQLYPEPVDPRGERKENAALWLKEIRHTGLAGGTADLPPVTFEGTQLPNRVDADGDGYSAIWRYRVTGIISESGGVTSVTYEDPDCAPGRLPASAETNRMRCYPVRWGKPAGGFETQWFHKYVVSSVIQSDVVSSGVDTETRYEYLDGAAWHWDDSEFAKDEKKTWNEFRGFGRVRIRTGSTSDPGGSPVTMTERRYHRGMNGDRGRTEEIRVADSLADGQSSRLDSDWLQGFEFESTTYAHAPRAGEPDPAVVDRTVSYPFWQGPTASRGAFHAYIIRSGTERTFTALESGGFRETKSTTRYENPEARGLASSVDDFGNVATGADDRCITMTYAPDRTTWLLDKVTRTEVEAVSCAATPRFPDHAIADTRFTHDGDGNVTKTEVAKERPAAGPVYTTAGTAEHDKYGRVTASTDAMGKRDTIVYAPAEGGPATGVTTTSPATTALPQGLVTTTTLDPAFGLPTKVVDPNQRVTEITYDALGRTTEVWLPNRPKADNPQGSTRYAYLIQRDAPSAVTARVVGPNGVHTTSNSIYDGWSRLRQVQTAAVGMREEPGRQPVPVDEGRLIVDTRYDSHGRPYKTTQSYFNNSAVDTRLWVASDTEIPGLTRTKYDGAGRPVEKIYQTGTDEAWRTTMRYGGDRVHTTPPAGGTATTVISDARGDTTELRQHQAPGVFDTTRYEYTPAGQLAKVTGPDGAVWQYGYDLRGRKVTETDPDAGTTTMGYDDAGRLTSTVDAMGRVLVRGYDELGRRTELREDSPTGEPLATWTYDTVPAGKGLPATATRYLGEDEYTTSVDNYTALNKPLSTSVTVPAAEGLLAGTYTWGYGYGADGTLSSERYPAAPAANLAAQTVNYGTDHWGRPTSTRTGTTQLVANTLYTRYGEIERIEHGVTSKRAWQSFYYDTNTRRVTRSIVDAEVTKPMQSDVHYTYDDAGTITSMADLTLDRDADVQCFRHDHLRRLTEAWTAAATTWSEEDGCEAEPAVAPGPAPYWHTYRHSPGGNRLEETRRTPGATATRTYNYPTGDQPHTLTSVTAPGATESYEYNAIGQTTGRTTPGADQDLSWDREGHLTSVTGTGGTTSFVYTADGDRLLRKDSGGTTLYLGKQEIRLSAAGGTPSVTRYYTHGGNTVAMQQGGTLTWLAGDHQGTSQLAINPTTLAVTQRRQLPFGGARGSAPTWPGDRGFVGGTKDASTDLTHLGAREYDPALGRFISVDPLMDKADPQQMQGYAYANNSPVTMSDPTGLVAASGPDGECAKHCMFKPGHNPATNHPADFAHNSRNCKSGAWSCTATGGRGKPPQNTTRNCADGAKTCPVAQGSRPAWEIEQERRIEAAKREASKRELEGRLPADVKNLINIDELLEFDVWSLCYEKAASFIVSATARGCFNFDSVGLSMSFSGEVGVEAAIGAHAAVVVRGLKGVTAGKLDKGFHGVVTANPFKPGHKGIGFSTGAETTVDGKKAQFVEFRAGPGFHPTLGIGVAAQFGLNTGYIIEWNQLKLAVNQLGEKLRR